MDVASLQSLVNVATVKNISNQTVVQSSTETAQAQTSKDIYESKLAKIASKYDVANISPRQMKEMGNELYENGLISLLSYGMMANQSEVDDPDYSSNNLGQIARPDEPRDMLTYWKRATAYSAPSASVDAGKNMQKFVDELETLASIYHNKSSSSKSAESIKDVVNAQVAASSYSDAISKTTADAQSVVKVLEALASHSQNKSSSSTA